VGAPASASDRPASAGRETTLLLPALLAAFAGVAWLVYTPALHGPPIADDVAYLLNPWVRDPTPAHVVEILDPTSQATRALRNYAPLRALLHAAEWKLFAENEAAYHAVNVALHAGASLLVGLFLRSLGVSALGALAGATLFLVHPANVEAVAWMSQLWSPVGLALALGALLALPRRPALATLLFGLALLSRPTAVFALPTGAALEWWRSRPRGGGAREGPAAPARWPWLGLWAALVAGFAVAQVAAFIESEARAPAGETPLDHLRAMAVIALRYLVMAATSYGVAAFQEPVFPTSWLDPWALAAAAVLLLLAARLARTLRRRSAEAVGWVMALAGFAPVSQLFRFPFPIADRYLYFIMPGLLAAGILACEAALARIGGGALGGAGGGRRRAASAVALVAALVVAIGFGLRAHERAAIWRAEETVLVDAALASPTGTLALLLASRQAAQAGDVEGAIAPLREAAARDWDWYDGLLAHPLYAPVSGDPRFRSFIAELAGARIEKSRRLVRVTQLDLSAVAAAHELRGELEPALEALERALALGGPLDAELRARAGSLRARLAAKSGREIEPRSP
jgi:hypothetical protein